jgi:putative Mn2+ efflux pump MntP
VFDVTLKIAAVAISLALDVFAVSVGIGMRGAPRVVKVRIGIAFASAEIAMNVIGAGIGVAIGQLLGQVAGYLGFGALIVLGAYMVYGSLYRPANQPPLDLSKSWGLALASLTISVDSLGIGFSILYIGVPVTLTLAAIGAASVLSTALGLMLGSRLGRHIEDQAEMLSGVVLALTGVAFTLLKALHAG